MISPSSILRKWMIDQGLGTVSGTWPIFSTFLPQTPDEAICIYDTIGKYDGRLMATGESVGHPGVQVRIRAKAYSVVFDKAYAVAVAIDQIRRTPVSIGAEDFLIHNISRGGSFHPLGEEDEGDRRRHHITINGLMTLSMRESGEWTPYSVIGGG